jgi:sugar/nucleoside kinase (ribokinase family)
MTKRHYDVLVIGDLNVDIILTGDTAPVFSQVEKVVDDLVLVPGGSAAIFAAGAAKLGLRTALIGKVGNDTFGHYMLEALRGVNVDSSQVIVDQAIKTGATIVLSRGTDRAMLTYRGSIAALTEADVDRSWFQKARHLHVTSFFLQSGLCSAIPNLLAEAHASGMTTSLDTNWDPNGEWNLGGSLAQVDVFLPNENEAKALAGEVDLDHALEKLAAEVPLLVVKRGELGVLALRGRERVEVPAFPVDTRDATGAGDAFDAGFLAGWLRGLPLVQCLRLGCACGALCTTQMGGCKGQPTWAEAKAFVARHCN